MSVGAFDVLKMCETFATLSDALADVSLAIGTTSGQARGTIPAPLASVLPAAGIASCVEKVAFVFGDERDGLTASDLMRCHHVVTIPTNPKFPALNVAQAVGITAYELAMLNLADSSLTVSEHPPGHSDDHLFVLLGELLDQIQFSRRYNRHVILQELRCLYQRIYPSEREANILKGIILKLKQQPSDIDQND